jgi:GT2 family glycosyltransferase
MTSAAPAFVQTGGHDDQSPFISIVVPVYRTELSYLRALLDSVRAQRDPDWELVLIDDGSDDEPLTASIRRAAGQDSRIRHEKLGSNAGIVTASNRGLALCRGEFVALLDHDDLISADAVQRCREALRIAPETDVLYSDELIIGPDGDILGEFRKPAYSPERLRGQMYPLHLCVYRRSLLLDIGGFRTGFDGSQDYDLILRACEYARSVTSIPYPLYSWRILPTSVSHAEGNEYVFESARRALAEHLGRAGTIASFAQISDAPMFRVDRVVPPEVTVSVVITSVGGFALNAAGDEPLLASAVRRLASAAGNRLADVTVVAGGALARDESSELVAEVEASLRDRGHLLRVNGDPRAAAGINEAVLRARGRFVLMVDDTVVPTRDDWLTILLGLGMDPGIAVIGPRLIGSDGYLAAAGLATSGGRIRYIGSGCDADDPGPFGGLQLTREVTAVPPDCLLIARSTFLRLGGLSLRMWGAATMVDLSLKAAELGLRTVVAAACEVRLARPAEAPSGPHCEPLEQRWGPRIGYDRYWRDL